MNTFFKIALGCLIVPIVLIVVLVIVGLTVRKSAPLVHRDEKAGLDQPLAGVTQSQLASEGLQAGTTAPAGRALMVDLDLEEGNFTIVAGPPGSNIRVDGDYDAGAYDLSQEMTADAAGQPRYELRFRPRYSMFHRMLAEGGMHIDENDNKLTVYLPRGIPMALNAQISKGSSHLQLGGLALASARLELSMGEHTLTVEEQNPLEMSTLDMNLSMGESRIQDLGNLRAGKIEVWGKMGEVRLDFGEAIARDTKLIARMKMGEMSLRVPRDARVKARTSAFMADTSGHVADDERRGGFLLDIDSSASFGDVKYQRN